MTAINKIGNEYASAFGELYAKTPKAVFAAIVWSYASAGGDWPEHGVKNFLDEWQALFDNGIVAQKPPKKSERKEVPIE